MTARTALALGCAGLLVVGACSVPDAAATGAAPDPGIAFPDGGVAVPGGGQPEAGGQGGFGALPGSRTGQLPRLEPDGASTLRFTGVGFTEENGLVAHAMVVRQRDDWPVALTVRPVEHGLFRFRFQDLLDPAESYRVELFMSEELLCECHMPPDHAFRAVLPAAEGALDFYFERPGLMSEEACAAFQSNSLEP